MTAAPPSWQSELEALRQAIDSVDDAILALLNQRARLVLQVGQLKTAHQQELYVPSRERTIFERLKALNPGPFPNEAIRRVYREIISASLSLEHPLRVIFLGPKATFTHVAAMQQFGHSAQLMPARSISSVFEEVACGRAHFGVVPVENSNEGAVSHTLDMFLESRLTILHEIYLEISHDLLSKSGKIEEIRTVYSHPQALAQCRKWLDENLPDIPRVEMASTARAAQVVADEENGAAIASAAAANLYGLQVVAQRIEDNHHNTTRFLVIGQTRAKPSGHDRTSLLLTIRDEPGILARMLEPFRNHDINLMKIESRPVKNSAFSYVFFLDAEGHCDDPPLAAAIQALRPFCAQLKILGSYPRAR